MYLSVLLLFFLWAPALTLKNLNFSVPEEAIAGTIVGNLGNDVKLGISERGKKSNFRVLENSAPNLIDVEQDTGLVTTKQRIDRETLCRRNLKCQVSLEVFANDKEIYMIKVDITDINDNSPFFPSEQIDIDISENAFPGTRFPLTSAHDPDSGEFGLKTYVINHNGLFSLDVKSRGDGTKFPELVIEKPLDREEQSHHNLILTALDGGNPPRSATVQINVKVIDSNDNSPVFEAPSYMVEIPENSPLGRVVIDLNATDADEGSNGEVIYSFSGYAPDRVRELFSIDPNTGVIQVKGNLDYEENNLIEIDVQARDQGPNPIPAHCKVTVKVIDKNDNAPSIGFVSVRQGAISEAALPGTVIALVRVTDKDSGKNGQLQCRVLGNVPFKLEENYDNFYTVVTDRPLDRETQDEYNVTIIARDNGNPSLNSSKSFTVKILDENDNPPTFNKGMHVLQVSENNIPGEYLGSVVAHDPDLGHNGTVSYSILPSYVGDVSIYTFVSVNPTNGAVYALRSFNYEQTKYFEFKLLAKDSGSPHLESNVTVRVTVLDVNDNAPVISLPILQNDTAEIHVPRNVGVGYVVSTVRAMDNDFGESGRLTYEIAYGNEDHLFEIDPVTGEIKTLNPYWEEVSPIVELVIKVTDNGKPALSAVAKLIIKSTTGSLPEGEPRVNGKQHQWDMSLPLIVTLSTISIILLAAMITIAVKCKRENKEIRTYNCRIAEYSHPQLGKSKKKKINKNDIMLVQSEVEERNAMNVMNVVSSPSLATSPMYFDYQTRLPLSSPRSEVMYLKPTSNNLTVPQGHVGCHNSFTGPVSNTTETTSNRMSIIQALKTLNYSISEEGGTRNAIGNINDAQLELPERGKKATFRVLENSAPHLLDVDQNSGLLYTKQRIDRETLCKNSPKCILSLEVFANDKEICMIKVEILDINDNSPKFASEQIDIEISENAYPGTRFPLTTAQDPDLGNNGLKTYKIRGDYGLFSLDIKSRGDGTKVPELVIQKGLDREEQSHHTLILTAFDGGNPPRSANLQINIKVIDANDNSPVFEAKSYTVEIAENSPIGKMIIDLNATDADEGSNADILYSFSGYASDHVWELFSIDSKTGIIQVKGNIDYEEIEMLEIDVQAEDQGPNPIPVHCKVTVLVSDINDNFPSISFVSVRQGAISEASPPGTVIALVRVTDKDSGKNGQFQCWVLGNVPFKLEDNYDNFFTVVTSRPLDREIQDEYNITIIARDNGNPSLDSTNSFSVKILDENDNPPCFSKTMYALQVSANNIPGEYLGSVLAQDPDLGQNGTVSYSIFPTYIDSVSVYTYVSINPRNGAIYALRTFYYELTKYFEFKVIAKDLGSPHLESNTTVRVSVLDVNNNAPVIILPSLQNDTAEIYVPRNVGMGYIISTIRAMDIDFGESGRMTYEIIQESKEHLFEIDPVTGEIKLINPHWEDVAPVVELIIKVTDNGKPSLSTVAKLIIKANADCLGCFEDEDHVIGDQRDWDIYLPVLVALSAISIILFAAMVTIVVKCKKETKEVGPYNSRTTYTTQPKLGKMKKKKINKNDIMLVQSELEEKNAMNVVSCPLLVTSPMYFDCQSRLPLSSSHSEVMYLTPTSNTKTEPQENVGCHSHTNDTGQVKTTAENTTTWIPLTKTDNFPAESNYIGSRQQFVQSSSTFKDPERASLRDSGHGDSDQADSDQDTNKGSCCDMSVREALKMKTTSAKCQPLEQDPCCKTLDRCNAKSVCKTACTEQEECVNCTDECRVLGHSDRCWMPQFPTANQVENADYRTNLFVPTVEAHVETETYETVNPTGKKTFCTFGKDKREHTILIANVKPYLKAKRALSPLLQEGPSASSSPTKTCIEPCASTKGPLNGCEIKSGILAETTNQYLSSDNQYISPSKQTKDPQYIASDLMAHVFADVHSRVSRDSSEMDAVLDHLEHSNRDLGRESVDADEVVREIDKLLQDCRGSEPVAVRK